MSTLAMKGMGWLRDLPDGHDQIATSEQTATLLAGLPVRDRLPISVDCREYCVDVDDQSQCNTSVAHACAGLLQYYERRATGRIIQPSRLFMYKTAQRLSQRQPQSNGVIDGGVSLRTMWKAVVRFGTAAEHVWPFDPGNVGLDPDPFTYAFDGRLDSLRYIRLDGPEDSGEETLQRVLRCMAAGFACVFGFSIFDSIGPQADISVPSQCDTAIGGQAVMLVGYDDHRRYRSSRGALLIRNSWGSQWGEQGYGWLPYDYVRRKLAVDFWMIAHRRWLESGEFFRPDLQPRSR